MSRITDLFTQPTLINYINNRTFPTLLGETLFPATKIQSLKLQYLRAGSNVPVIAPIAAFDTEAQIGSREAAIQEAELGYIKRKMQLKEEDLIALNNPRTVQEEQYLKQQVYNDVDNLVAGVNARVELMRMQALSTGKVTASEDNPTTVVDYQVPLEHQVKPAKVWTDEASDPIQDMQDWISTMNIAPTRALTSNKVQTALLRHKGIAQYFKTAGMIPTIGNLNALLQQFGLPTLVTYDQQYREQQADGTYKKQRYFPEDAFVMFGPDTLGNTVYGPTPEENRYLSGGTQDSNIGNVFVTIYESNLDPIGTWEKAAATALPSFADADNVLQVSGLLAATKDDKQEAGGTGN
ncbi:major capsid protein [Lactobacillus sp. CC-MHH1034]|uniref:major capsid protein n=1 Tax=Agrilactobacillus fermenti TaxID=2586909 RepID=UPI001E3947D5|nr:major capsid protein [Agrilactobacillus fermenti]MCD2255771.1 major capsid protein [Agrilactobacillus fermenti]